MNIRPVLADGPCRLTMHLRWCEKIPQTLLGPAARLRRCTALTGCLDCQRMGCWIALRATCLQMMRSPPPHQRAALQDGQVPELIYPHSLVCKSLTFGSISKATVHMYSP